MSNTRQRQDPRAACSSGPRSCEALFAWVGLGESFPRVEIRQALENDPRRPDDRHLFLARACKRAIRCNPDAVRNLLRLCHRGLVLGKGGEIESSVEAHRIAFRGDTMG